MDKLAELVDIVFENVSTPTASEIEDLFGISIANHLKDCLYDTNYKDNLFSDGYTVCQKYGSGKNQTANAVIIEVLSVTFDVVMDESNNFVLSLKMGEANVRQQ